MECVADPAKDNAENHAVAVRDGIEDFAYRVLIVYAIGIALLLAMALLRVAAPVLLLVFAAMLLAILLHGAARALSHVLERALDRSLPGGLPASPPVSAPVSSPAVAPVSSPASVSATSTFTSPVTSPAPSLVPYSMALALVLLLITLGLGTGGWLLAPQMSQQFDQIVVALPTSFEALRVYLERFDWTRAFLRHLPPLETVIAGASETLLQFGSIFTGVVGALVNALIVIFVAVYLAFRPQTYVDGFLRLLPKVKRQRGKAVLHHLGDTLYSWLLGKLLSMVVVGIATSIGLLLLDVPLALALGLLAGVLDFIPYIGPLLAATPAVLIAFSQSPALALSVAVLFIALQCAESYLLSPLVERRSVALPPALTITVQVLTGLLFGLPGVALATPLTAVMTELVKKLYVQGVLGDHAPI